MWKMADKSSNAPSSSSSASAALSAFRNVSACNRCRVRKNRCDQRLPACMPCEKAGVICVGYDPITKKEIPRSYVFYLETRVEYLESVLQRNSVQYSPAENFVLSKLPQAKTSNHGDNDSDPAVPLRGSIKTEDQTHDLVSQASKIPVQGTSDSRYLGSTSGITFARVVFAAVKSSVSAAGERDRGGRRESTSINERSRQSSNTSMRDSFFGLHTKPTIEPAPFPSKQLGSKLVDLYFQHTNPQFPILHRPEFMTLFERVYSSETQARTAKESYLLNMVFAIGAGIIVGKPIEIDSNIDPNLQSSDSDGPPNKRRRVTDQRQQQQRQPEEYHASAIVHLETVLKGAASPSNGATSELEELQAVLLLAGFALLRPVPPGLWYIIGVAVRLAIDLGLHAEDSESLVPYGNQGNEHIPRSTNSSRKSSDAKLIGRKQYNTDFRRRLWWCVYSFDRLVSSVVGRPFGVPDSFITTGFPSILDDEHITTEGITPLSGDEEEEEESDASSHVSYKRVSYHYFRLRILHSEILTVLQYRQTQLARERGLVAQANEWMLVDQPCSFLKAFDGSFGRWREDMDMRLAQWRSSAPQQHETGVAFSPLFLELNYWQTILMLYRQSLSTPADLMDDYRSATESVQSPHIVDEENMEQVFTKVAEAGQKVLKLYRLIHRKYLVNYTYLSTHHLFMAGISFLYAIWHSPLVRSYLTLDDVDFTSLAATSVLDDLVAFCPPARACRDAFSRMTKATIKMCLATTGFGTTTYTSANTSKGPSSASSTGLDLPNSPLRDMHQHSQQHSVQQQAFVHQQIQTHHPLQQSNAPLDPHNPNFAYAPLKHRQPSFDPDLRSLFSEEERINKSLGQRFRATNTSHFFPTMDMFTTPDSSAYSAQMQNQQQQPSSGVEFDMSGTAIRRFGAPPDASSAATSAAAGEYATGSGPSEVSAAKHSTHHSTSQTPSQPTPTIPASQAHVQPNPVSPWSELDFLESVSLSEPFDGVGSGGTGDPLGLDSGFGLGWDGNLSGMGMGWNADGGAESLDMFDGFFFGQTYLGTGFPGGNTDNDGNGAHGGNTGIDEDT